MLLSHYVEPDLIQPTFLYDYPRDISPLAKSKPEDSSIVERFEGFVAGMELCNAFTELNDPFDQEQRFLEMGRDDAADDEERHPLDEDETCKPCATECPPMAASAWESIG